MFSMPTLKEFENISISLRHSILCLSLIRLLLFFRFLSNHEMYSSQNHFFQSPFYLEKLQKSLPFCFISFPFVNFFSAVFVILRAMILHHSKFVFLFRRHFWKLILVATVILLGVLLTSSLKRDELPPRHKLAKYNMDVSEKDRK